MGAQLRRYFPALEKHFLFRRISRADATLVAGKDE
jgi:hypothetical protein